MSAVLESSNAPAGAPSGSGSLARDRGHRPSAAIAPISLDGVLRLLDARNGSYAGVRPTRRGLLRVCAHAPATVDSTDITGLRVLLTADLLARAAELGELQVLTALSFDGQPPAQETAFERAADALGVHPPAARTSCQDAQASLAGPIDVHLAGYGASVDTGRGGLLTLVGAARLRTTEDTLAGPGRDPLAVRLALESYPYHQTADLTPSVLADADEAIGHWRHLVAEWARSPSKPMPASVAGTIQAAFADLDTVSLLALLRGLVPDASVPAGAKFETFVYADRVLGLDLPRSIGRTGG
jgi:hypothetical protein